MVAQSRPSNVPIEQILLGKGELQKQRLAEREARLQQREQAQRATSKVNPKSVQIVQQRYILQGETTEERLQRSIGKVKPKTLEEIEKPTFKPTLNPTSIEIANAATGVNLHYTAQEAAALDLSPEQASFKRFYDLASQQEYDGSDGPLLYEDLVRSTGGGGPRGRGGGSANSAETAMYLKTQRWNEARQQKLEKERKERERQEKQICTFKPKIDA
jgi:hypothetical protein